jgi:serine/threonine protein kinase
MVKIKLSAGSKHSKPQEARAIKNLQHILSREDGHLIPILFVGKQLINWEIDAVLLLPDIIFFIDFKDWYAQRIEIDGLNGPIRIFAHGAWEERENTLLEYDYAARIMAKKLEKQSQWLPTPPRIHSVLVFTRPPNAIPAQVSFAGGNANRPTPKDGVGACNIEQLPLLITEFRAASNKKVRLTPVQLSVLADFFLTEIKPRPDLQQRRIEDYRIIAEHHEDKFLNCKIYLGEGYLFNEQVWIKEYEQVFTTPEERDQRDRLILRHADVLHRFPQHEHIVNYRAYKSTDFHLYVILSRKPGVFLSELLYGKPSGNTTQADLQRFTFNLQDRLQILGDLLSALDYLTQQQGFERSAYRDLRPDNIFVQLTNAFPVAQLFNFDCTKIPGSYTKFSNIKSGHNRFPLWDDYASPELLEYIDTTSDASRASFTGDVSGDLFSWAVVAWEMLVGELPFADTEAKLANQRKPWPGHLIPQLQAEADLLSQRKIQLIEACLDRFPARRPSLATLRSHFP